MLLKDGEQEIEVGEQVRSTCNVILSCLLFSFQVAEKDILSNIAPFAFWNRC